MEVREAIAASRRISVVMITRDQRERTIERPAILVVDNGVLGRDAGRAHIERDVRRTERFA